MRHTRVAAPDRERELEAFDRLMRERPTPVNERIKTCSRST